MNILYTNIDQKLVNSLHGLWNMWNCEIGGLDCRVITTEYRTRVHCIHMYHLFCNALVRVVHWSMKLIREYLVIQYKGPKSTARIFCWHVAHLCWHVAHQVGFQLILNQSSNRSSHFFIFFIFIFIIILSVRLSSVLRGHSFFSSLPQRPMTSDFEGFLNQILSITLFSYLNSWERARISLFNVEC